MNPTNDIVPWECHICRAEFDAPSGGICSRCTRATCRTHLHSAGKKLKLESRRVCEECLTKEEKSAKKWTLKLPNLPFKRFAKKNRRAS